MLYCKHGLKSTLGLAKTNYIPFSDLQAVPHSHQDTCKVSLNPSTIFMFLIVSYLRAYTQAVFFALGWGVKLGAHYRICGGLVL